jgi:hypothetical protein
MYLSILVEILDPTLTSDAWYGRLHIGYVTQVIARSAAPEYSEVTL